MPPATDTSVREFPLLWVQACSSKACICYLHGTVWHTRAGAGWMESEVLFWKTGCCGHAESDTRLGEGLQEPPGPGRRMSLSLI